MFETTDKTIWDRSGITLNEPNKAPGKMKLPRALELINALIDHMINAEGGHSRRVIGPLLDIGFTAEELTEDFCFPAGNVEDILAEEGKRNG